VERPVLIPPVARRAALAAAVAALAAGGAGCLKKPGFSCDRTDQCTGGTGGQCEANGYCSFIDGDCASGRRFGEHSGPVAGQCVEGGSGVDAAIDATPVDAPACPSSYMAIAGGTATHVYRFVNTAVAWATQRNTCTNDGAYLFEPADAAEMTAVNTFANAAGAVELWIGITDQGAEGTFLTTRNAVPPYLTTAWEGGEPDDSPNPGDCVRASATGTFADDRCTNPRRAVCECEL